MELDGQLVVATDHDVEFRFTVTNTGTDSVELAFASGFVADFAVHRDDDEVWRWSDGRMFTQALQTETIAPGETFTHTGTWKDPKPGAYEAVATLEATNVDLEARTAFDV